MVCPLQPNALQGIDIWSLGVCFFDFSAVNISPKAFLFDSIMQYSKQGRHEFHQGTTESSMYAARNAAMRQHVPRNSCLRDVILRTCCNLRTRYTAGAVALALSVQAAVGPAPLSAPASSIS